MDLEEIRKKIDETDDRILELFCRRMDLAKNVAEYKIENSMQVNRPEREKIILERVKENAGEYGEYAEEFYRTILEVSRDMQQKLIDGRASGDA